VGGGGGAKTKILRQSLYCFKSRPDGKKGRQDARRWKENPGISIEYEKKTRSKDESQGENIPTPLSLRGHNYQKERNRGRGVDRTEST